MAQEQFIVYFTGSLREGVEIEECVRRFAHRFHVSAEKARQLIEGGKEVVLKKRLDAQTAETYRSALEKLGMGAKVEPMRSQIPDAAPTQTDTGTQPPPLAADNPYAAPGADLLTEADPGTLNGPHARPTGHGWLWLKQGFSLFKQNPLAWILVVIIWAVLAIVLSMIPFAGQLLSTLLSPVLMAGIMLGCREQERGGKFQVSHLFAGFSNNAGQLVLLGVVMMIATLVIMAILAMIGGGAFLAMGGLHAMQQPDPTQMLAGKSVATVLLLVFVGLALWVPLSMAYYFAPALVAIEGMSPMSAFKLSLSGCLKNVLPMLWYGILAFVFMVLGSIPIGLGLLVVMPMLLAALYMSYRDIYYD